MVRKNLSLLFLFFSCSLVFSNPHNFLRGLHFSNPFSTENKEEKSEDESVGESIKSIQKFIEKLQSRNKDLKERLQCYALQRHILRALNSYEKKEKQKIVIFGEGELKTLVEKGYLPKVPRDPGCSAGDNYRSDHEGNIWCHNHGTLGGSSILIKGGWMSEEDAEGTGVCNIVSREPEFIDL